ncbi:LytR C-terminal domain-containing protein [Schaalia suimastitidis]|uniref:LytR C-terminal domain-containing protein n=1 Tax=Schaalia suimastitidis TaxID=121163 RepID=UPI00041B83E7|nr:LytR C-terminal domain-containing protein [Schaalia suimastitidis]
MTSEYPKDEFDHVGEDMPVGMHRPRPSKWKAVLPFLIILIVVPLIGWGVSYLLTSRGIVDSSTLESVQSSTTQSTETTTETTTDTQTSEQTTETTTTEETPAETTTETPVVEQPPAPVITYGANVAVLNGTGITGLAAEKVATLTSGGFTNATADNATGWNTTVSTVYYRDASLADTAAEIARILGIGTTTESTDVGSSDVVVVLK